MDSSASQTPTVSQRDQWMVEHRIFQIYDFFGGLPRKAQSAMLELQRENHMEYLIKGLKRLEPSFSVLDANRPWLCYWILHSIALLGECVEPELEDNVVDFLSHCQDPNGGYGGGPGQMPHLATTYAAVNALITVGGERSLSSINRMHDAGEIDVRACYTAISVASFLNILDNELVQNVGDYIVRCQTYEGGIAGEPGAEAHGGYTFCGFATMILINEANRLDLAGLLDWVAFRQGKECGFQGRTNKLIDSCYSFWQGGVFALLQRFHSTLDEQLALPHSGEGDCTNDSQKTGLNASCPVNLNSIGYNFIKQPAETEPLFHSLALQQYILLCGQDIEGGMRDKPGKGRDYYHTCYSLSGLSGCQYSSAEDEDSPPLPSAVMGPYSNLLEPIHPLFNVVLEKYYEAHEFFAMS
ncbi:protein farnesyltransferase subunit beta isoform X2 [Corylus avellana]|uniref:protein farnesyltransferase subunit beta isoform X2 n=1 Tax=Corylus avellana TaxID=13451 RepID=UPI00286C63CE|nr:protein farnesyltransferase subunit beta isoform X2 [Corylus avellana]